jgi:hypothetical protein
MIGSLLFARNRGQIKHLFLSATIPFLILGVVTQASVQYQTRIAWREQQDIWQKLFLTVPNFVDETVVLFILPGYLDRVGYQNWQRTPLYSSWEVTSGLRLLYDNSTLSADVIFPSIETAVESILTTEGIITKDTGAFTPYARLVAFVYDSQVGTLMQLDHLPPELIGGTVDAIKLCTNCVRSENLINVPLRRLVQN